MPDKPRKADERDAEIADLKRQLAESRASEHLARLTLQRYQEPERIRLVEAYEQQLSEASTDA